MILKTKLHNWSLQFSKPVPKCGNRDERRAASETYQLSSTKLKSGTILRFVLRLSVYFVVASADQLQSVQTASRIDQALHTSRSGVWGRRGTSVHQRTSRKLQERGRFHHYLLPLPLDYPIFLSPCCSLPRCGLSFPVGPLISQRGRGRRGDRETGKPRCSVRRLTRTKPAGRQEKESKRERGREAGELTSKWGEAGEAEVKRDRPSLLQGPRLVQSGTARLLLHAPRGRTANVDTNT